MADIKDTTAGLGASQPASTEPRVDEKGRSVVDDVNRSLYDFTKSEEGYERYADGLTPEIVRAISAKKNEPEWMLEMRLKALETYHEMEMPANWGPSIDGLDLNNISTFVSPKAKQARGWNDVPDDIKDTFERLGIPQAERESLAGVGAQYDSEIVYHNMREEVAKYGVVYTTIEDALQDPEWEPVVREYFGTLIPMLDHKFAALHYAVWSGGSFVYVPKGVTVEYPLQSYFRLNAQGAGQFEHTLIIVDEGADLHFIEGCSAPKYYDANLHAGAVELFVKDGARLRYSTIENWSKNMFNLNTKRARATARPATSPASPSPAPRRTSTPAARSSSPAPTPRPRSRPSPSPKTAASTPSAAPSSSAATPSAPAPRSRASRSCSTTSAAPTPSPRWTSAAPRHRSATRPRSAASPTTRSSTS